MQGRVSRSVITIGAVLSLVASPALASASAPTRTVSPMVALSIFGSQSSAAALCGASATTVAAGAAASAQAPGAGCVLPVVDAPPPLPAAEPLPAAQPIATSGFGIAPVLLGLAGIAILAALIAGSNDDNDNEPPVSVN